ncbi:MAG TPA: ABC transporter permease [Candidatus Saccharimonadales bacterium]
MKSLTKGQLKSGVDAFRKAKLRNFWTMLGIIIGVASVILVIAISEGVKQQINGHINHIGADIITVQPNAVHVGGSSYDSVTLLSGINVSGSLSSKDVTSITNTKDVSQVAPLSAMTASVKGNQGSYKSAVVIGTTPNFASLVNQQMQNGVFLTDNDDTTNGVVIGSQTAIDLFNEDVPLGLTLYINGQPYIVRGVLSSFQATPLSSGAEFNKAVFITYTNAQALTSNTATTYQILVKPTSPSQTAAVRARVYNRLLSSHGGQADFSVLDQQQTLANSSAVLTLVTKMIIGVAAISLIVGGIGIMNVMLVSVTERMHEIGIRKALGATNRQILNQFMIEATMLSLIGGLIGVLCAFIVDIMLRVLTNLRPIISWQIVVLACLVSIGIGVIFGSFPALKAARRDPIEALRAE